MRVIAIYGLLTGVLLGCKAVRPPASEAKLDIDGTATVGLTAELKQQTPGLVFLYFADHASCTGAKVGHRLYMTAAHCVTSSSSGRVIKQELGSGNWLGISTRSKVELQRPLDESFDVKATIVRTFVHTSFSYADMNRNIPEITSDIALILIAEPNPIPFAEIAMNTQPASAREVIIGGYGCFDSNDYYNPDNADNTLRLGKVNLPNQKAALCAGLSDQSRPHNHIIDSFYVVTRGAFFHNEVTKPENRDCLEKVVGDVTPFLEREQEVRHPSLCPGDSGGPIYIQESGNWKVWGVNSRFRRADPAPAPAGRRPVIGIGVIDGKQGVLNLHTRVNAPTMTWWLKQVLLIDRQLTEPETYLKGLESVLIDRRLSYEAYRPMALVRGDLSFARQKKVVHEDYEYDFDIGQDIKVSSVAVNLTPIRGETCGGKRIGQQTIGIRGIVVEDEGGTSRRLVPKAGDLHTFVAAPGDLTEFSIKKFLYLMYPNEVSEQRLADYCFVSMRARTSLALSADGIRGAIIQNLPADLRANLSARGWQP